MNNYFFLAIAILSEVIATSALKSSDGFTKFVPSVIVVTGYGAAFYFLSITLKTIPVGIAYAVWSGLGVVLVTAVAWVLHGQKLDSWGSLALALLSAALPCSTCYLKQVRIEIKRILTIPSRGTAHKLRLWVPSRLRRCGGPSRQTLGGFSHGNR
jgi:multidrug transporter EmrE-like cation transporter